MFGLYYQARVIEKEAWFLVALLRSFEHLAFDRTLDRETSTFEFFVPEGNEKPFREFMDYCLAQGVIASYSQMANRLIDPEAIV